MAEKVGRPKKFKCVEDMKVLIDGYFESCFREEKLYNKNGDVVGFETVQFRPFTITGLCIALDTNRENLLNYSKDDEFFDTISHAKMKCHNYAEEHLYTAKNPAGVIFNLKNNYGWKDKTEQEVTVTGGLADELKAARERGNS